MSLDINSVKNNIVSKIENDLASEFKKDEEKLNVKTNDISILTKDIDDKIALADSMLDAAKNSFVPELKDDIVFGKDEWGARERFLMQKQQLNAVICAHHALSIYQETTEEAKETMVSFNEYQPMDAQAYADQVASNEIVDKEINTALNVNERRANVYINYKKRNHLVYRLIGIISIIIELVGFAGIVACAITLESSNGPLYRFAFNMLFASIGVMVVFQFLAIFTLINAGRFKRNNNRVDAYFRDYNALKNTITSDLNEIVGTYVARHSAFVTSFVENKESIINKCQTCLPLLKEKVEEAQEMVDKFTFCKDMPLERINEIYEVMQDGLADSYSAAVRYIKNGYNY